MIFSKLKNVFKTGKRTGPVSNELMFEEIVNRRNLGNPTHTIQCYDCQIYHPIFSNNYNDLISALSNFKEKHRNHHCEASSVPIWIHNQGWKPNSDVKEAMQAEQSLTVTNLHSLANSATAGWGSAAIDNSSNLYLDSQVMAHIAAVNTAPGSDKAFYIFTYGSTDGAIWTSTGTSGGTVGTEGLLTFPSISTLPVVMPSLGVLPYPVQNKALDGGPFTVARCFGGVLPISWGIAVINFTGFQTAASGNTMKYRGAYNTVI